MRVRAKNIHGWSVDFSEAALIKAAQIPDKMEKVTTSIDVDSGSVRIDWIEPHDGHELIDSYLIEIQQSDGGWLQ